MLKSVRLFVQGCVVAAVMGMPFTAAAQDFPSRSIKIVVPWPAGGVVDIAMRVISERLAERLNQPVVVDNRPGANGIIGTQLVVKAPADGYTLLAASAEILAINPQTYDQLRYDVTKDFSLIGPAVKLQHVLTSRADWPADNVEKSLSLLREKPSTYTYASWGIGSVPQIGMEMLLADKDIKVLHVPFNGGPPAFNGLMAGLVDLMVMPVLAAKPFKDGNRIKVLGIAADKRSPLMADVPTMSEQGFDLLIDNTVGFVAPANTPPAVVQKLSTEIAQVLGEEDIRKRLTELGSEVLALSPDQYAEHIKREYEQWGSTIRRANIRIKN